MKNMKNMKNMNNSRIIRNLLIANLLCGFAISSQAAVVTQVANTTGGKDWNDASTWGATAVSGNTYVSSTGFSSSAVSVLGAPNFTSQLRENGVTFNGDSITLNSFSELLLKQTGNQASNANIILNGGTIRHGAGQNTLATIAGTLNVAAESWLGEAGGGTTSGLTISSTLTGSSTLHLASSSGDGRIAFTGNLSGFSGTLDIGNSQSNFKVTTVALNNASLGAATVKMGFYTSVDILELSGSVSMSALNFNGTTLSAGTYSVATLNSTFGNGSQFTGLGSITISSIPEPSTYAILVGLAGLTAGGMVRRRRR